MSKFNEAIEQIEEYTAGRFYEEEKQRVIDLIAKIHGLDEYETQRIKELYDNAAIENLKSLQSVLNATVMLEFKKNIEDLKALLLARKKELMSLERAPRWNSRESWLRYLHCKNNEIDRRLEEAVFLYAKGHKEQSLKIFKSYAESCHLFSLQACCAICRELNLKEDEMRYIAILEKVYEELLDTEAPEQIKARIKELPKKSFAEIKDNLDVDIDYFDESGYSRMAFKA